jgi:hypothetical protein
MKRGDGLIGVPDSIVPSSMTRVERPAKSAAGWAPDGMSEMAPLVREQNALLAQAVSYLKVIANR